MTLLQSYFVLFFRLFGIKNFSLSRAGRPQHVVFMDISLRSSSEKEGNIFLLEIIQFLKIKFT